MSEGSFVALTTFALDDEGKPHRSRTVGLFPSLDEACNILKNNYGDLNEAGYYPFAVAEILYWGLYPCQPPGACWFRWDEGRWEMVLEEEEPIISEKILKHMTHLATIG